MHKLHPHFSFFTQFRSFRQVTVPQKTHCPGEKGSSNPIIKRQ